MPPENSGPKGIEGQIWPNVAVGLQSTPVARPNVSPAMKSSLIRALDDAEISGASPIVGQVESAFSDFMGAYCLVTANGSVALTLALSAMGVDAGDEVLVPSLTYAATASAVVSVGAVPVFCDSDVGDWNVSLDSLKENVTHKTAAIIIVDIYGVTRNWAPVVAWAKTLGLGVVHDCAESFGAKWEGSPTGLESDIATFSFFANKLITSGEGGMVVTRDQRLLDKMRLLRGQGMSSRRYWFIEAGYNFRLSALQAALLPPQIEQIEEKLAQRWRIYRLYDELLEGVVNRVRGVMPDESDVAPWLYTVTLVGLRPLDLAHALARKGIETRPVFYPLDLQPAFSTYRRLENPTAKSISDAGISLPTYEEMTEPDVHRVARVIREAING